MLEVKKFSGTDQMGMGMACVSHVLTLGIAS